jgi:hypothetical protein
MTIVRISPPYLELDYPDCLPNKFYIGDHLGGFDQHKNCQLYEKLNSYAENNDCNYELLIDQHYSNDIKTKYSKLKFVYSHECFKKYNSVNDQFINYRIHPALTHKNFICSFNGSEHVSRKLLVAALNQWHWFNLKTCSKNFCFSEDQIDGYLNDFLGVEQHQFYKHFFIGNTSQNFFQLINNFDYDRYNHTNNIYTLESKLTESFLHVVSETMATSYYPFVTEKFLYSVVTRGLFLAYAQPGWHAHLEKYYGFKRYDKLFDYHFDTIQNPIERLVELMSMISKFSILSTDNWQTLYDIEKDTIEYNYDHYFSQNYLKSLETSV